MTIIYIIVFWLMSNKEIWTNSILNVPVAGLNSACVLYTDGEPLMEYLIWPQDGVKGFI